MKAFMTRRKSLLVAASAALALSLSACGGSSTSTSNPPVAEKPSFAADTTMAKLSSAGKIVIGTKFDQPLFGQKGLDGKPVGFDVEMGKLIAGKLGIPADKIEWKETVSANREQFIKNGDVDIIVATYTINDKRKAEVSFAGPYYEAGQALMVNKDNTSITKPEDVKGKNVCSVTGSTPAGTIVEKYGAVLVPAATYSACLEPLRNKQVEAITTDNVILAGFVAKEPDAFKLASDQTFTKEPYGIGLKKDDTAFRMWINDQLEAFDKDGSYKKAWEATAGTVTSAAVAALRSRIGWVDAIRALTNRSVGSISVA